jgi:hypothetical protein
VTRTPAVVAAAQAAGLAMILAGSVAACSDGTTPTCPQTDGGCSYAPVESGAYGDGGLADVVQAGEGGSDASE